jgi:hypothetical protein
VLRGRDRQRGIARLVDGLADIGRDVAGLVEAVEAEAADGLSAKAPSSVSSANSASACGLRRRTATLPPRRRRLKRVSSRRLISISVLASRRSVVEPSVISARAPSSVAMRSPVVSGRLRSTLIQSSESAL